MTVLVVATTVALAVGYVSGRSRPGERLLSWAEAQARRGRRSPGYWMAQPIFVVAIACKFAIGPRRFIANVRSWREKPTRGPAVQFTTDRQP